MGKQPKSSAKEIGKFDVKKDWITGFDRQMFHQPNCAFWMNKNVF